MKLRNLAVLNVLFLFLTAVAVEPDIVHYEQTFHDQVIELVLQDPFMIYSGKEFIDSGKISIEEFYAMAGTRLESALDCEFFQFSLLARLSNA